MNKLLCSFLLITSTLLVSTTVYADGVSSLKEFFQHTTAMRAHFKQEVLDAKGGQIQRVEGSMQLQRPNKFRWNYQQPYEQQIVSDGEQVYLYDVDLAQVTVRDLSKTLGFSPAALLAGGAEVEKSFTLKNAVRKDDLSWVLAIPKNKESGFDRVIIGFKDGELRRLELYDSFSHITHITFENIETNPVLDAKDFLFTPPKGVDVVGE